MELINKSELQNEKCLKQYKLKPKKTALLFVVCAIALIIYAPGIKTIFFGIVISIVPVINLFFIKDRVLLEIYDGFFVVYDEKDQQSGRKVAWDEVVEYSFVNEGQNSTVFKIAAGNEFMAVPTTDAGVLADFRKRIPNQESMTKNKIERDARRKERKAKRLKKGK